MKNTAQILVQAGKQTNKLLHTQPFIEASVRPLISSRTRPQLIIVLEAFSMRAKRAFLVVWNVAIVVWWAIRKNEQKDRKVHTHTHTQI